MPEHPPAIADARRQLDATIADLLAQAGQLSRQLAATIAEIERCRTLHDSLDGPRPS